MLHHLRTAALSLQTLRNKSQQKRGRFLLEASQTRPQDWDGDLKWRVIAVLNDAMKAADRSGHELQRVCCWKTLSVEGTLPKVDGPICPKEFA